MQANLGDCAACMRRKRRNRRPAGKQDAYDILFIWDKIICSHNVTYLE